MEVSSGTADLLLLFALPCRFRLEAGSCVCGCLVTQPGAVLADGIDTGLSKERDQKELNTFFVQFFPFFPILGNLLFSLCPTRSEAPFVGDM